MMNTVVRTVSMLLLTCWIAYGGILRPTADTREVDDATATVEAVTTGHWNLVTTSSGGRCIVLVFELPDLPAGKMVGSASFHIYFADHYDNRVGPTDSLYGLPFRSSATVTLDDFYEGAFFGDAIDACPIEDDLIPDFQTENVWHGSTTVGNFRLRRYLQQQYDSGAQEGDYIFLRLNSESDAFRMYSRHSFASIYYQGGTTNDPSPYSPYIAYDFVDTEAVVAIETVELGQAPELRPGLDPCDYTNPIRQQQYYLHERERLGYNPRFGVNSVQFDSQNRPYLRGKPTVVYTLNSEDRWVQLDFRPVLEDAFPDWNGEFTTFGPSSDDRIVFDNDDHAYLGVLLEGVGTVLLYSRDYCRTWQVYPLYKATGSLRVEYRDGYNDLSVPPSLLMRNIRTSSPPTLDLILPRKNPDGTLALSAKIRVDTPYSAIGGGLNAPMGAANMAVTSNGKTHVIYAGRTEEFGPESTPFFVASCTRSTGQITTPLYIGSAGDTDPCAVPDVHNQPGMVVDAQGYLHVILGAHGPSHGQCYRYAQSTAPNSTAAWEPLVNLPSGFTYPSFLCDAAGNMYVTGHDGTVDPTGLGLRHLMLLKKPAGQDWSTNKVDLVAPFADVDYGYIYNRYDPTLNTDRNGNLYISYWAGSALYNDMDAQVDAFEMKWPCQELALEAQEGDWFDPNRYDTRSARSRSAGLLNSKDGGQTWTLTITDDFLEEITTP